MRRPSTITVQAPHWPWSQPFLVPVRCRCSRSASSSVVRVSSVRVRLAVDLHRVFTRAERRAGPGAGGAVAACAGVAVAAAEAAPASSSSRRESVISSGVCMSRVAPCDSY
jgi:hypothetical protein